MYAKAFLAGLLALTLTTPSLATDLWQVYQDAVQQDPELAIEQSRLEQAQARVREASAQLLPAVQAGADWSHRAPQGAETLSNLTFSLSAEQALISGPAWYASRVAQEALHLAQTQFAYAQQGLILRSAEAYFEVLKTEDNLSALRAEEQAILRQLDQVREQYEVGLIALTDVLEAQAAYDAVLAARIGAEGAVLISYEALEQLTNQHYRQLYGLKETLPIRAPEPVARQAWLDLALTHNLALRVAMAATQIAQQALNADQTRHMPSVALYGQYQDHSHLRPGSVMVLGVRAQVELYGGGRTSAQIQRSSATLDEAFSTQEQVRRQVVQQTRSLFTLVNTDVLTVQAQAQAIRSAESALEATRIGYEVGTRNLVDVLNAERALWAKQRDYDAARYRYVVNQLRLKRAAGTLVQQDLQALNQWLVATAAE